MGKILIAVAAVGLASLIVFSVFVIGL